MSIPNFRRATTMIVVLVMVLSLFTTAVSAKPQQALAGPISFTILHTNDFHGNLELSGSNPIGIAQVVDDDQVTSHPRILAVGDCARRRGHRRAEHWEAAVHDGQRAAATILGIDAPARTGPWFWTDRYDLHVETVGEMRSPDADHQTVVRGTVGEPPFSVFAIRGEHVIGAAAVDDPNAGRAARRMIDRGVDVRASVLADPGTDLRKLLRAAR